MRYRRQSRILLAAVALLPLVAMAQNDPDDEVYGMPIPHTESSLMESIRGAEGTPAEPGAEQRRIWKRPLPFWAQQVIDLGYDLPRPFGAQIIYTNIRQDLRLSDLAAIINDGEKRSASFVEFDRPRTDSNVTQFKLDAWILPFLNVFALIGKIDGDALIPLAVPGDELLNFVSPTLGQLCNLGPALRPQICDETLTGVVNVDYEGTNLGGGILLAGGWRRAFMVFTTTYSRNDLDTLDSKTSAWDIATRLGVTLNTPLGEGAVYLGVDYLISEVDIQDSVTFSTADDPDVGQDLTIEYFISQKNADRTNYLLGANLSLSEAWQATGEIGFGGSRSAVMISLTRRF